MKVKRYPWAYPQSLHFAAFDTFASSFADTRRPSFEVGRLTCFGYIRFILRSDDQMSTYSSTHTTCRADRATSR
eukprot:1419492-Pleurochrysis_carterae.AAC.1